VWRKKLGADRNKSSPPFTNPFNHLNIGLLFIFILFFALIISSVSIPRLSIAHEENRSTIELDENGTDLELPDEFVRGYFNEISYETDESDITIEFIHPEAIRTYIWTYDDGWKGSTNYLDQGNTSYTNNQWVVNIAIHEDEPTGEWTVQVDDDTYEVTVVELEVSFAVKGDLEFWLEPYQEDIYVSEESVTFENTGNVKMKVQVNFDDENLTYELPREIFNPGESGDITFTYRATTEGAVKFSPSVSLEPYTLGAVSPEGEGNVAVISQGARGLNTEVTVGYRGYEQEEKDEYSIQYKNSIQVKGNTLNELMFYIYPNEEVYLTFNQENVTFEDENVTITVRGEDGEVLEENDFDPTEPLDPDYGEVKITVEFLSDREEDGFIELEVEREGDLDTYTTEIILTETAPEPGDEEVTFVEEQSETITLGIILIGGIVLIGAGRVWLSKREED